MYESPHPESNWDNPGPALFSRTNSDHASSSSLHVQERLREAVAYSQVL